MAVRGIKVGSAWVEVDYRVDTAKAVAQVAKFKQTAEKMADINGRLQIRTSDIRKALKDADVDIDHHSHGWGRLIGRNIVRGVDAGISMLPGRMEALFSGRGGPIGLALGAGILASLAGMMPAVGAMISGALFAGLGTATVAAGIALVAKDPRVVAAANRLKDMFTSKIWDSKGAEAYVRAVVPALDRVTAALEKWAPLINNMLISSSKFLDPMTTGLISFIDGFMAPMERMMNSSFMTTIMETFARGLGTLGAAFGSVFDKFLEDDDAMAGAVMGLNTMFSLLAGAIRTAADILVFLSAKWKQWNTEGADGLTTMDRVREVVSKIGEAFSFVAGLLMNILRPAFSIVVSLIRPLVPTLKEAALIIGGILYAAADGLANVLGWLAEKLKQNEEFTRFLSQSIGLLLIGLAAYHALIKIITVAKILWAAAQVILNIAMAPLTITIGLIVLAIVALIVIIVLIVKNLDWFKEKWNQIWGWIKAHAVAWWDNMFAFVSGWMQNIINWWNNSLNFIKDLWNNVWGAIKDFFILWWSTIFTVVQAGLDVVIGIFRPILEVIVSIWRTGFEVMIAVVLIAWELINRGVSAAFGFIRDLFTTSLDFLKNLWNVVWGNIKDGFTAIWDTIGVYIDQKLSGIRGLFEVVLNNIRTGWEAIWTAVQNFFRTRWDEIWAFINSMLDSIKNFINSVLEFIKGIWERAWTSIKDHLSLRWSEMKAGVELALSAIRDFIDRTMQAISTGWNSIWTGMWNVLGGIWNGIASAVTAGINAVIDVVNKGVDAINSVLEKLGISFRVTRLTRIGATTVAITPGTSGGAFSRKASGGKIVGPGTPTSDSVPILASRDEFMIKAASARKLGYRNLSYMNNTGQLPANLRYATGGRVGASNNSLLEQHRDHVHVAMSGPPMSWPLIVALAAKSGFPFRVTSTFRPGDRTPNGLSHHATGRAVDFGGYNQDGFASYWERIAGVIELIHRSNSRDYAIFGGKGGGGGIFGLLGKGIDWIMEHMLNGPFNALANSIPGGQVFGEVAKGTVPKIKEGVKQKIQEFVDSLYASNTGGSGPGGGAERWRETGLQALRMLGLPSSWIGPLLTLIQRESGGNPNAINLWDSNAQRGTPSIGLMQTIGPTFERHKLPGYNNIRDPLSNILAGLRYIVSRYGSIFNVQQAVGATPRGYRTGGWLMPGELAYNETSKPEAVFNHTQLKALTSSGSGVSINELHVHVGGSVSDAEAKKIATQIRDELIKIGKRNGGKLGLPGS